MHRHLERRHRPGYAQDAAPRVLGRIIRSPGRGAIFEKQRWHRTRSLARVERHNVLEDKAAVYQSEQLPESGEWGNWEYHYHIASSAFSTSLLVCAGNRSWNWDGVSRSFSDGVNGIWSVWTFGIYEVKYRQQWLLQSWASLFKYRSKGRAS